MSEKLVIEHVRDPSPAERFRPGADPHFAGGTLVFPGFVKRWVVDEAARILAASRYTRAARLTGARCVRYSLPVSHVEDDSRIATYERKLFVVELNRYLPKRVPGITRIAVETRVFGRPVTEAELLEVPPASTPDKIAAGLELVPVRQVIDPDNGCRPGAHVDRPGGTFSFPPEFPETLVAEVIYALNGSYYVYQAVLEPGLPVVRYTLSLRVGDPAPEWLAAHVHVAAIGAPVRPVVISRMHTHVGGIVARWLKDHTAPPTLYEFESSAYGA